MQMKNRHMTLEDHMEIRSGLLCPVYVNIIYNLYALPLRPTRHLHEKSALPSQEEHPWFRTQLWCNSGRLHRASRKIRLRALRRYAIALIESIRPSQARKQLPDQTSQRGRLRSWSHPPATGRRRHREWSYRPLPSSGSLHRRRIQARY